MDEVTIPGRHPTNDEPLKDEITPLLMVQRAFEFEKMREENDQTRTEKSAGVVISESGESTKETSDDEGDGSGEENGDDEGDEDEEDDDDDVGRDQDEEEGSDEEETNGNHDIKSSSSESAVLISPSAVESNQMIANYLKRKYPNFIPHQWGLRFEGRPFDFLIPYSPCIGIVLLKVSCFERLDRFLS